MDFTACFLTRSVGRQRELGAITFTGLTESFMAEQKRPSIAEILAAARAKKKTGETPASEISSDAEPLSGAPIDSVTLPEDASTSVEVSDNQSLGPSKKPAAAGPVTKAPPGSRPSVADILAMSRAKKAAGEDAPAKTPAPKSPAAASKGVAAKPASAKPVATAKPTAMPRDTESILSQARSGTKPGPMSKADAPQKIVAPKPVVTAQRSSDPSKGTPTPRTVPPMPIKPVKSTAKADASATEDRRGFLSFAAGSFMAIGFTSLSITTGLFTLGLARFMFPNVLAEPPSRFKVGSKEGFPPGKVETKYVAQFGVWVVNSEFQGVQQVYALKTVCTHLGCTPNWLEAEQKFKCPCHGSGFYKDGVNFEGPAPRPLERYAIRLADDGQLEINKSKTFHEELGQWSDPESYIVS